MGRKQALTEFHRGAILAAAERLFAEKGTDRTTMDDIAREAEYSKATLYVYFQSKAEIIHAILLSGMLLLEKKLREVLSGGDSWIQTFETLLERLISFCRDDPTTFTAITCGIGPEEPAERNSGAAQEIRRITYEIDRALADFLERGIREGIVRSDLNPMETVLLFWSAMAGFSMTSGNCPDCIRGRSGLSQDEFLYSGIRFLLQSILSK